MKLFRAQKLTNISFFLCLSLARFLSRSLSLSLSLSVSLSRSLALSRSLLTNHILIFFLPYCFPADWIFAAIQFSF